MVDQSLVEQKFSASRELIERLVAAKAPLLVAYWEWGFEKDRWVLFLVPESTADERRLVEVTSPIMIQAPFHSIFSLSDVVVDAQQIERAQAIGNYVRSPQDIGQRFDTTFTGRHYFEGVIVMYVSPKLKRSHHAA
jgi:hypothetical protein